MPQDIKISSAHKEGYNIWLDDVLIVGLDFNRRDKHGVPIGRPVVYVWENSALDQPPDHEIVLGSSVLLNPRLEIAEVDDDDVMQTYFGLQLVVGDERVLVRVGNLSLEDNPREDLFREYRSLRKAGEQMQSLMPGMPLVNSDHVNNWYEKTFSAAFASRMLGEERNNT